MPLPLLLLRARRGRRGALEGSLAHEHTIRNYHTIRNDYHTIRNIFSVLSCDPCSMYTLSQSGMAGD